MPSSRRLKTRALGPALGLFLAASGLAAASPALAAAQAPALGCNPTAGTVLSAKVLSKKVVWMPTNDASIWKPGPGTISMTTSTTAEVGVSVSASFTLKESLIFASAEETYGISLSGSVSHTEAWGYSSPVPKGKTARIVVYHRGYELGIRQVVVTSTAKKPCGTKTETSLTGNFFPMGSTANANYCAVLTIHRNSPIEISAKCKNLL
jgi:hypothetical protein